MKPRISTLFLLLVFLAGLSSAASFGSYPVDSEKTTHELGVEFRIGLFNPGNTTAEVAFSAQESTDYNISFPDGVMVEPSPVTRTPSGSGWYHLGDGRYTKIEETGFTVDISRYRSSNILEIPVTVEASASDAEEGNATSRLVYAQDHIFTAEITGQEPENGETGDNQGIDWIEIEDDPDINQNRTSEEPESQNGSESYKPGRNNTEPEGSGVDSVTLVLLIGIAVTAIYLYRVS